jgi:hypothetical protein
LLFIVKVEIAEHLAGGVADDERRGRQLGLFLLGIFIFHFGLCRLPS